jgi:hypothetical protein
VPPSPNPGESRESAAIRWLTSLLAALVEQSGDRQLIVSREALAADHGEESLVESKAKDGSILLRFDTPRFMAIYPLGGPSQWPQAKIEPSSTVSSPIPTPEPFLSQTNLFPQNQSPVGSSLPKDATELRRMEETLRKQKLANQIVARQRDQAQQKVQSLESLLETAEVLGRDRR